MSEFDNTTIKTCPQCGQEITTDAKFCISCGAKLETEPVTPIIAEVVNETPRDAGEIKINYQPVDTTYTETQNTTFSQQAPTPATPVYQAQPVKQGNGMIGISIASMVCGIISIVCCCAWYFSIILAIAAIVLGVVSIVNKYEGRGMAIAGIATAGVMLVMFVIVILLAGADVFSEVIDSIKYDLY